MEFMFVVWMIGTLPTIGKGLVFFGLILSGAALFWKVVMTVEREETKVHKWLFLTIPVVIIGAIIPDKETAYAMAAGYGVQSVVENERVQKIAGQGVDVLEQYLMKTKKELEKEATPAK